MTPLNKQITVTRRTLLSMLVMDVLGTLGATWEWLSPAGKTGVVILQPRYKLSFQVLRKRN